MFFFLRGGSTNSKFSQFQIFPKLIRGGMGGIKFPIFPKFKKVQNIPWDGGWGGDQENYGGFSLFVTFFNSDASPFF